MIKIITPGTRNRIECYYCGAILSYDKEDVKQREAHFGLDSRIIKSIECPQCKNIITLEGMR